MPVKYNRTKKKWQLTDSNDNVIASSNAGLIGKTEIELKELELNAPTLYILATAFGKDNLRFMHRLIRAANVVRAGDVYKVPEKRSAANYRSREVVRSQSDRDVYYNVEFNYGAYSCNCEDFERGATMHLEGYGQVCSHALASHLAYCSGIYLDDAPRGAKNDHT